MAWPFKKKNKNTLSISKRMYAGAMIDRLTSDWIAQGTSQDAEVMSSLPKLRNRSRQLGRDNDYVKNFFRSVQNNVVGKGIPFQAQVKMQRGNKLDEKTNDLIENLWCEWSRKENCHVAGRLTFRDIERLVIRGVFESGEILVRFVYQPMGSLRTPFSLEIIESDQLDDTYNGIGVGGNIIRMGVEKDQWGRPVAYHILTRHPGDSGVLISSNLYRQRISASEILHIFATERPNQTRGIPAIASAITRLRHMQGYEEAEVIAARASAALMGFIETPEEDVSLKDGVDAGQSVTEFEPGVFKKLDPGEKVTIPSVSRPGGQFDPFMRLMLRGFAAGAGMSYMGASKDSSQSNYSSSRLELLEERDHWRATQAWLIDNFHQPVFEKFLDLAVLAGELSLKGYELTPSIYRNVRWMPRGWAWVDPLKEVNAFRQAVRSGFMTQTEVIAQSGGDFDEFMDVRKREVDSADEAGLVFDTNPEFVSSTGVAQPVPPDPSADPASGPNPDGTAPADE